MHDENYSKIFTMRSKFRHLQLCIVKTLIIWTSKWIWLNIYGKYKREKSVKLKKIPIDPAITLFTWTCFGVNKMRRPLHPLATSKKKRERIYFDFHCASRIHWSLFTGSQVKSNTTTTSSMIFYSSRRAFKPISFPITSHSNVFSFPNKYFEMK